MAPKTGGEFYKLHQELGWTLQVAPRTGCELYKRHQEL